MMPEGACLVNCARQGIINEDDLREIKLTKKLYYCTDVYEKDIAGEKAIADVADVMLPHVGANTIEANTNAAQRAAIQIVDWTKLGLKTFVVNKGVPEDLEEDYQRLAYYLARMASDYHSNSGNTNPQSIETSFYGGLNKFGNWLTPSVALGLGRDFDPSFDSSDASNYLKDMGINYQTREVDDSKRYGESITVDLIGGEGATYEKVSMRGTLTEGVPMISRINNFSNLYFNPVGHSALIEYKDRPGVLASITDIIGKRGVNILDIRAPQDKENGLALAVCILDSALPKDALAEIKETVGATKALSFDL